MLLCLLGACAAEDPGPFIDAPPLRFYYDAVKGPPCAGTAPYLARVVARQASWLGLPLPERIDYHYRYANLAPDCPASAPACADERNGVPTVWTQYPSMPHELVHAIVFPMRPVRFFAEGLAVALGGDDGLVAPPLSFYSTPPEKLFDGSLEDRLVYYPLAGDFAAHLLDRYGPEPFVRLSARAVRGTTTPEVLATFNDIYGVTLEQAMAERVAAADLHADARLGFPECGEEPTPWHDGRWSLSGTVDCADTGISTSPYSPAVVRYVTTDVPADGFYRVVFQGDPSSVYFHAFNLQRCGSGEQITYWSTGSPITTHLVMAGRHPLTVAWLRAGRHFVHASGNVEERMTFSASLEPSSMGSVTCNQTANDIDPQTDGVYVVPSLAEPPAVLRFTVPTVRAAKPMFSGASFALCDDVCSTDGTGCTMPTTSDMLTLQPGHTYALVSRATSPRGFAGLALP